MIKVSRLGLFASIIFWCGFPLPRFVELYSGAAYSSVSVGSAADKIQWFDAVRRNALFEVQTLFRLNKRLLTARMEENNYDALLLAVSCSGIELVEYLLQQGADIKTVCARNETVLHKAVQANNFFLVEFLLAGGVDLFAFNVEQKMAISFSTNKYITQFLIDAAVKKEIELSK